MKREIGSWIKNDGEKKNVNLIFANNFSFERDQWVTFKIVAADLYKIFIDGVSVFCGPTRTAHGYAIRNTFTYYFTQGVHLISLFITSYGISSYYIIKQPPFLKMDFSIDNESFSEKSFKCFKYSDRIQNVQRYSFQRGFVEIYRQEKTFHDLIRQKIFSEKSSVLIDVALPKTIEESFSLSPLSASVLGQRISQGYFATDDALKKWQDRSLDQVGNDFEGFFKEELYENLTDFVTSLRYQHTKIDNLRGGAFQLFDFKRNISGFIKLELAVLEDAEIYLAFDEMLDDQGNLSPIRLACANVIKLEFNPGNYIFESNEINTLRFLNVICRQGLIELIKAEVILVENADAYHYKLATQDEQLLDIFAAAQNTMAQNSFDLLTDCPSRERAGWINDFYFSKRAASLLFQNEKIVNQTLLNYILCPQLQELPLGMVPMCYPSDHLNGNFIANNALWFIICVIEQLQKGELLAYKEQIVQKVYEIFAYFSRYQNSDGLLEDLDGWIFIEWSIANSDAFIQGVNYPCNMLFYKALRLAGEVLQDRKLLAQAKRVRAGIIALSFNGEWFIDNSVRDDNGHLHKTTNCSETCQYYAAFSGVLAGSVNHKTFLNKLVHRVDEQQFDGKSNIIPGLLMRLEMLMNLNEFALALTETKMIFGVMAASSKTLWENTSHHASLNHGIASYAACVIERSLRGRKNA
ncbi:MAG: hypothetical protein ACOX3K_05225 [Bacilli bacterium]